MNFLAPFRTLGKTSKFFRPVHDPIHQSSSFEFFSKKAWVKQVQT